MTAETIQLIAPSQWVEPTLKINDQNDALTFHIQDALNYHGHDAVGGVVLGFRLLQKAIFVWQQFFETSTIERRAVSLFTAFPGLGARDCFELVTRMATGQRIYVDTSLIPPMSLAGVEGSFYFKFDYKHEKKSHSIALAPINGYPSEAFLALGKASKKADFTPEQELAWKNAKLTLANTLLSTHFNDVVQEL